MYDRDFLIWIYNRLINVHGENEHVDYMHKLRAVIKATPGDQLTPNAETANSLDEMLEELERVESMEDLRPINADPRPSTGGDYGKCLNIQKSIENHELCRVVPGKNAVIIQMFEVPSEDGETAKIQHFVSIEMKDEEMYPHLLLEAKQYLARLHSDV